MKNKLLYLVLVATLLLSLGFSVNSQNVSAQRKQMDVADDITYAEAPMLADLVAAGDLPPVEERLPSNPLVLTPNPEYSQMIGDYGGTIHTVATESTMSVIKMWLYDPAIRWKADLSGYEPGLASSFTWSADGTEVTFTFREGLKWSDGEPFTMDDLEFWWVDMATNPNVYTVNIPRYLWNQNTYDTNGNLTPCDVSFPNDITMVWTCDHPIYIEPYILAQGFWEWEPLISPKHYLQEYHPDYNASSTYEDLMKAREWWWNPAMPTMMAWHLSDVAEGEWFLFDRNPYYWKIDSAGNQLPYIDSIYVEVELDNEQRLANLAAGIYDASFRGSEDNLVFEHDFLVANETAGGYTVYDGWVNGSGAYPALVINQDYTGGDPWDMDAVEIETREMLRNKLFRRALSVAVNREALCVAAWGEDKCEAPYLNFTVSPQAMHFKSTQGQALYQDWSTSFNEFDATQAATWLTQAGLVDLDDDGWRDLPSGEPFELIIDQTCYTGWYVESTMLPLVETAYQNIGIRTTILDICGEDAIYERHEVTGEMMVRTMGASEIDLWTFPAWVFPLHEARNWPMETRFLITGGAEGWDPNGPHGDSNAVGLLAIYNQAAQEPEAAEREALFETAIRDYHITEGPFTIALGGDVVRSVVIKNGLMNVQNYGVLAPWAPGSPGNTYPELWYWHADVAIDMTAPVLKTPANASTVYGGRPTLKWTPVEDAVYYSIEFKNPAGEVIHYWNTEGNCDPIAERCEHRIMEDLANNYGIYSWRVKANLGSWQSEWTSPFTFNYARLDRTVLLTPEDGSSTMDRTPTFSWENVDGETYHQLQVRLADDTLVLEELYPASDICTGEVCSVEITTELADGGYKWHARGKNGLNFAPWTPYWYFTIGLDALDTPVLKTPANDSIVYGGRPTFKWEPVDYAQSYTLQLLNPSGVLIGDWFTDDECDLVLDRCEFRLPFDLESSFGEYSWRVQASTEAIQSDWSEYFSFHYTQLARTWLISPEDGYTTTVKTPTLQWGQIEGATMYLVQIRNYADQIVVQGLVADSDACASGVCTWAVDPALAVRNYKWHVRAKNGRNFGRWTAYRLITIQ